jgi:hypothetical protein
MKKRGAIVLLGILLIGIFGAVIVSAATSNGSTNYGFGFMNNWRGRNPENNSCPGYCPGYSKGNNSYCPCISSNQSIELKVKNADEAYETARSKIDGNVSKDNIYQMGRWWVVPYQDKNGTSSQARIDAVTGEIFTGYPDSAERCGIYSHGHCQGFGRCRGYGS